MRCGWREGGREGREGREGQWEERGACGGLVMEEEKGEEGTGFWRVILGFESWP